MKRFIQLSLLATLLSACTVGPDYQRPQTDLPGTWTDGAAAKADVAEWWRHFEDEELLRLIEESLAHNHELRVAVANVEAAAAALRLTNADYFPDLNAGISATRHRTGEAGAFPPGAATEHRAGLFVNYELDIFGRVRRANEAALAELRADAAVRDGVRSAVAAAVANAWFEARALQRRIELLERLHATRLDDMRLQKVRLEAGIISAYDVEQARAETAAVAARLPGLHAGYRQAMTALAVLRGVSPREMVEMWSSSSERTDSTITYLPAAPSVPMGLPSDLLERRPDIRAAEQRLVAANARIGEAKARYFPTISLTGFFGGVSESFSSLFDGSARSWQGGADLALPMSDLNRTGSNVASARARHDAVLAAYARAVQLAFKETLDALENVNAAREQMIAHSERVDALMKAYDVAEARYSAGGIGYLGLLDVERQLRDVEQEQVAAQLQLLQSTVDLYRSLGGGWQEPAAGMAGTAMTN